MNNSDDMLESSAPGDTNDDPTSSDSFDSDKENKNKSQKLKAKKVLLNNDRKELSKMKDIIK